MIQPLRIRPGSAGVADYPTDNQEATNVENMILREDGTWEARKGYQVVAAAGGSVNHVSNHPDGTVMAVVGSDLIKIDIAGVSATTVAVGGWSSRIAPCPAAGQSENYWMSPPCRSDGGDGDDLPVAVDPSGVLGTVSITQLGTMMCTVGGLTFLGNAVDNDISWSDDSDCLTWQAANLFRVTGVGKLERLIALGDHQVLTMGHQGIGLVSAPDSTNVAQQLLSATGVPNGLSAVKCGDHGVFWHGANNRVYRFRGVVDVLPDLLPNTLSNDVNYASSSGHWDPYNGWYMLRGTGDSFLFDVARNRWAGKVTADLIGCAQSNESSNVRRTVHGLGTNLVAYGSSSYADAGSSFDCVVESVSLVGNIENQRQIQKIWLDASNDGLDSWTVDIYGRDHEEEFWTPIDSQLVGAPTWLYPSPHLYRQRKLVFSCPASAHTKFREALIFERVVRASQ